MNDDIIEFYVEKFDYIKNSAQADLSFVPPLARRRMSSLDKVCAYTMNKCMDDEVEYIVFASGCGEVERLLKIIEQYSTDREVSPSAFSGSVHNFPMSSFLLNCKKAIPYNAISGGDNSISSGILSALVSDYENIIFCFGNKNGDEFESFSVKISKKFKKQSKKCIFRKRNTPKIDNFDEYIKFFNGEIPMIKSYIFEIESGCND